MNLSDIYENMYGQENQVPNEELDKIAAASFELVKEADAHGRMMAHEYVKSMIGRMQG